VISASARLSGAPSDAGKTTADDSNTRTLGDFTAGLPFSYLVVAAGTAQFNMNANEAILNLCFRLVGTPGNLKSERLRLLH
jgi:hypothetical protein